jgi:hypothetical protein
MWDFFKQASLLFKIQLIFFALMALFFALIGLSYLSGSIEVKHGIEPDKYGGYGDVDTYACKPYIPGDCR